MVSNCLLRRRRTREVLAQEGAKGSLRDMYVPGIKILSRVCVQLDRPVPATIRVTLMVTSHDDCFANVASSKSFGFVKELLPDHGLGRCFEPWFEGVDGWIVPNNAWEGADVDSDVTGRESWRDEEG